MIQQSFKWVQYLTLGKKKKEKKLLREILHSGSLDKKKPVEFVKLQKLHSKKKSKFEAIWG